MSAKKINYLLSFPRSGNTWFRYCVEFLSKKPTNFTYKNRNQTISKMYKDMGVNIKDELILYKIHHFNKTRLSRSYKKDNLILLVRNPFEVIVRGNKKIRKKILFKRINNYIDNIETFHRWKSRKALVYYENLIKKPEKQLKRILKFLNINNKYLPELMKNYDLHKNRSIQFYCKIADTSFTKGSVTKLKYHSLIANENNLNTIKQEIFQKHKKLVNQYLIQYI